MGYTKACVFLLYYVFNSYHCLILIPERAEVIFYSKEYFEDTPILNVRRYSRKGDYVINLIYTNKKALDNTLTLDINFYQYLHNEFRRSFPELHNINLCNLVNNDPLLGKTLRNAGATCPIGPGRHAVTNMTFNNKFPFEWPYEKGMMEYIIYAVEGVMIAKGTIVSTFKGDKKNKT